MSWDHFHDWNKIHHYINSLSTCIEMKIILKNSNPNYDRIPIPEIIIHVPTFSCIHHMHHTLVNYNIQLMLSIYMEWILFDPELWWLDMDHVYVNFQETWQNSQHFMRYLEGEKKMAAPSFWLCRLGAHWSRNWIFVRSLFAIP